MTTSKLVMRENNTTVCLTAPGIIELKSNQLDDLQANKVLIKTRCSLISTGTEMSLYKVEKSKSSAWQEFAQLPRSMGYCNTGMVVGCGENVDPSWRGQRVASRGSHAEFVAVSGGNSTRT